MSVNNFRPTIWSDVVFSQYDNRFVFAGLANRSYEGEISGFGDRVKINEIGDATVTSYTGSAITYETPIGAEQFLDINQAEYCAQTYGDLDRAQDNPKLMTEIARKIGVGLAGRADAYIAGLYGEAGNVVGSTGSPTSLTSVNVTEYFSIMSQYLDENNVPNDNRVAVVPPWLYHKLRLAKITKDTNNSPILNTGFVGNFLDWEVYTSNNVAHTSTTWYAPMFFRAGDSIAFAEQLNAVEAFRSPDLFSDNIRALMVYGAKIVRPSSVGVLYCASGSEA